ncbi:tetratricopeptide repeat protein [Roseovarius ramblicola]|uniref:Tetratricopeptide repeat protein n=1 Tax=Roseovarius ramblicola TaxID=2022336 RepID=A0ABV5I3B8_9RHOB
MSDTDSFIDEVTEEVRRDRLFRLMRRYGWIAVLAILLLVGGAAWNEWRKARAEAEAQAFGDAVLAALAQENADERADALQAITPPGPGAAAVAALLAASEQARTDAPGAATRLLALADRADVPAIYRRIATLKAVALPGSGLSPGQRRDRLAPLADQPGLVRLLAGEQLAMIEIETGARAAALDRLTALAVDAEATGPLRRRVAQVIVALGEDVPEIPGTPRQDGLGQ